MYNHDTNINVLEFTKRLKKYKEDNDLKNSDLAKLLDTQSPRVSKFLNNSENLKDDITEPTIKNIINLSVNTGISTDYWLGLENDSTPKKDDEEITYKQLIKILIKLSQKSIPIPLSSSAVSETDYLSVGEDYETYPYNHNLSEYEQQEVNYSVTKIIIRDDLITRLIREYDSIKQLKGVLADEVYESVVEDYLNIYNMNIDSRSVNMENNSSLNDNEYFLKSNDILKERKSSEDSNKNLKIEDLPNY